MSHIDGYNLNTLTFRDQSEDRRINFIIVGLGNWTEVGERVWGVMDAGTGQIVDTRETHKGAEELAACLEGMRAKQKRVDEIFASADAKIAALTEIIKGWHAEAAAELGEQEDADRKPS